MDESERRRERLNAMRSEAARGEASLANQVQVSGLPTTSSLANPLTDPSSFQQVTPSASRFDYYTDPLASFSSNRRGHVGSHGPRAVAPSPDHGRVRSLGQISPHPEPWNSRMAMHPFPGPPAYQARCSSTGLLPYRAPMGPDYPFLQQHEMPPGVGNSPGCAVNYHPQINLPRGPNFHNYGVQSGRHDFGHGRGRGSYSGREGGNWADNQARMGYKQSSNKIPGSTNLTPRSLYEKFMVDDPWRSLKPSLWHEETPEVPLPAPKTVGSKRPLEVSTHSMSKSQSLAEYLAESFNEAVNGDPDL